MDLDEWTATVHPRLVGLEAFLDINFSRRSMADLERVGHRDDDAAAAYLGETLLRVGGGEWVEVDGEFMVAADPALGLPPADVYDLITEAGGPTRVFDEWAAAAAERRSADPGWEPDIEYSPGFGPEEVSEDARATDRWLSAREDAFPAWVARWAPDGFWDFSPGSLDRLTALLHRKLGGDPAAITDPAAGDLVDVAAWYAGESFRQAGNGQWSLDDPPAVMCLGHRMEDVEPLEELATAMTTPGHLGTQWMRFAGISVTPAPLGQTG